ncbi:MAG TPA: hypothetical protein VK053_00545 [Jiangellaceae bacterium]|nr:hypothetical protein [Jiangellaceae bacterium]
MTTLTPQTRAGAEDLARFARRVARFEPEAVVRLLGGGRVVACVAETPFDALAIRATALAEPAPELDVVLEAQTLAARSVGERGEIELPPALPALRWTTSVPPRSGWELVHTLPAVDVVEAVAAGVQEFKSRAPAATEGMDRRAGRSVLEGLAAEIWERDLVAGTPLRLAHAATSYRFLPEEIDQAQGSVEIRHNGPWRRLDAAHGSVAARGSGLALFAL